MFLIGSTPALAQSPESVVKRFYQAYWNSQDEDKTILSNRHTFTPGLYNLLDRALRLEHKAGGCSDAFFVVGNGGWGDWEVGRASIDGNNSIVPLTLWCGLRSEEVRKNPRLRRDWEYKYYANVYLTNLGQGWQIYNMQVLPHRNQATKDLFKGYSVRKNAQQVIAELSKLKL